MPRQLARRRSPKSTVPASLDPQDGTNDYEDDEEEEEEAPRTQRRTAARTSRPAKAAKPARSSREYPDDEDDEDDDEYVDPEDLQGASVPRRGASARRAAPAAKPSRARRSRPDDEDDEDEDEAPRRGSTVRKRQAPERAAKSSLGSGWDAYKANKDKASKYHKEDQFKAVAGEEEQLVIFLEGTPFATYNEHGTGHGKGYRAYVCLGDDCPFCEYGDTPSYRAAFNIAVLDPDGNAAVKYWIATPGPLDAIEEHAFNQRYGPLDKPGNYFAVSSKKNKKTGYGEYKIDRVTEAQVTDEFQVDPLTEEEIEELLVDVFAGKDIVHLKTRKELREIVEGSED